MRIPNFFIVGAAKAGTTSLTSQLKACPSVFMTTPKEPEFFARDDRFAKGLESYSRLYDGAEPGQICGESSTIYSLVPHFPDAARRIAETIPDARIIYMMRHPIKRCYSMYQEVLKHYQNASGSGAINRSFEEFLFPEQFPDRAPREQVFAPFDAHLPDQPGLFLDGSDYALQVAEYQKHFAPEAIRFILFEDYVQNTTAYLEDVLVFLGLDPAEAQIAAAHESRNVSREHFSKVSDQQAIARFKDSLFDTRPLTSKLPKSWRRQLRETFLSVSRMSGAAKPLTPEPMLPETRQWLMDYFSPRYGEIERLTGLDLTPWREQDMAWQQRLGKAS